LREGKKKGSGKIFHRIEYHTEPGNNDYLKEKGKREGKSLAGEILEKLR